MSRYIRSLAIAIGIFLLVFVFLVNHKPPVNGIIVERQISPEKVTELNVSDWGTWKKEPSTFVWQFPEQETIYVTKGEVLVTPENSSQSVLIKEGDFAIFAAGLHSHWNVTQTFEKRVTLADTPVTHFYWMTVFKAKNAHRKMKELF
jgi:uncharacterized protein